MSEDEGAIVQERGEYAEPDVEPVEEIEEDESEEEIEVEAEEDESERIEEREDEMVSGWRREYACSGPGLSCVPSIAST